MNENDVVSMKKTYTRNVMTEKGADELPRNGEIKVCQKSTSKTTNLRRPLKRLFPF